MWFDSWSDLGRILVVGPLAYLALVAVLRTSGSRTLSKLNAFDLVVVTTPDRLTPDHRRQPRP